MHEPNIVRIDLNLFLVFDAIRREGSISRAARHLNLTQPAVSHALGRLRQRLDDPLFVRRGNRMVPTARARALAEPVAEALAGLQQCLAQEQEFDPARARRTVVLGLRDGLEAVALPPLISHLAREAPGIALQSVRVRRRDLSQELATGDVDLALDALVPVSDDVERLPLVDVPLAVVMRRGHPLNGKMTRRDYVSARHVLVSSRRRGPGLEDLGLAQLGYRRLLALRCQHYQAALEVVAHSDLLLTIPELLARRLAPATRFAIAPMPLPLPPLGLYLYWHRDQTRDPAHQWLRNLFTEKIRAVLPPDGKQKDSYAKSRHLSRRR